MWWAVVLHIRHMYKLQKRYRDVASGDLFPLAEELSILAFC